MKKTLGILFLSMFLLAACNAGGNGNENNEQADDSEQDEAANETEQSEDKGDLTEDSLIQNAIANSEGVLSYKGDHEFTVEQGEETTTVQSVVSYDDQNEMKLSVDNNGDVTSHYMMDGSHYIYDNNQLNEVDSTESLEANSYETVVSNLSNYPVGELSSLEEGYAITINIDDMSVLEPLLNDNLNEIASTFNNVNGTMQLFFDAEERFTGSQLEATVSGEDGDAGAEATITATSDYTSIGGIEAIERPQNLNE